jgi:hypothetical protein
VNIGFNDPKDQIKWINDNLTNVRDHFGAARLQEMGRRIPDIGRYLFASGRSAIAHAFSDPIKDPDAPVDVLAARQETELMHSLAMLFIRHELKVPSLYDVLDAHLYELAGFKKLFGDSMVTRLMGAETIPASAFPPLPPLTIRLRVQTVDGIEYPCMQALPFLVIACESGVVILKSDTSKQGVGVALRLDFPKENLEFLLDDLRVNPGLLTKQHEISLLRFLMDYVGNGQLRIHDESTRERISHKLAYIPLNVDQGATANGLQKRIDKLEAELQAQSSS